MKRKGVGLIAYIIAFMVGGGDLNSKKKFSLITTILLLILFLFVSCGSGSSSEKPGALIYQGKLYYNVPNDAFSDYRPDDAIEIAHMIGYVEDTELPSEELTNNMYIAQGDKIYIFNKDYDTLYIWNHRGCLKFTVQN